METSCNLKVYNTLNIKKDVGAAEYGSSRYLKSFTILQTSLLH